jgi:prophage DNA circulation protein
MSWTTPPLLASLNNVPFEVETADDGHGRALVEHLYPGRDVPDLQDTGAEPQRIRLEGFIMGEGWLGQVRRLRAEVDRPGLQTLVHPQWGRQQGRVRSLDVRHVHDEHDFARITLEFIVGRVQGFAFEIGASPTAAAAAVESAAADVAAALAALEGT